jgi:hypothetical protein
MINSVNVSDQTHAFTEEDYGQLAWNGSHQYVTQACERINGHGGQGSSHGGCDGRGGGCSTSGNCNASLIELVRNGEQPDASTRQQQQSRNEDLCAQHGNGFGCGGCLPVLFTHWGAGTVCLVCIWIGQFGFVLV